MPKERMVRDGTLLALRWRKGSLATNEGNLQKLGKDKETESLPEFPERNSAMLVTP